MTDQELQALAQKWSDRGKWDNPPNGSVVAGPSFYAATDLAEYALKLVEERDAARKGLFTHLTGEHQLAEPTYEQLKERVEFLTQACAKQDDEISQTLGKVLGYPCGTRMIKPTSQELPKKLGCASESVSQKTWRCKPPIGSLS